ncbi:MAG: helix-turn-helix domain-containing protein [Treponema sp.]|jgi:hypothetical protein|nr:helix-turn-helix domain-containing protein [Treponema sp.]
MKNLPKQLSSEDLALILNVNNTTVRKLAKTNQLPCMYIKRRLCFDLGKVLNHLKQLEGGII